MQFIVTLNPNLTMQQRTQLLMTYDCGMPALAQISPRTTGLIFSTTQDAALIAALDADPNVASYAPFVPVAVDFFADFGDTLDDIGVVPTAPAQPSEWELRGSKNGE